MEYKVNIESKTITLAGEFTYKGFNEIFEKYKDYKFKTESKTLEKDRSNVYYPFIDDKVPYNPNPNQREPLVWYEDSI